MDVLLNVLIAWFNGAVAVLTTLANPVSLAVVMVFIGFAMCARSEAEELDRQGAKPIIGRH